MNVPTITEVTDELRALGWTGITAAIRDDDRYALLATRDADPLVSIVAAADEVHDAYLRLLRQARELTA